MDALFEHCRGEKHKKNRANFDPFAAGDRGQGESVRARARLAPITSFEKPELISFYKALQNYLPFSVCSRMLRRVRARLMSISTLEKLESVSF